MWQTMGPRDLAGVPAHPPVRFFPAITVELEDILFITICMLDLAEFQVGGGGGTRF